MKTIIAALLFFLFVQTANARSLYVVPPQVTVNGHTYQTGSLDSNASGWGTSDTQAFATPDFAATKTIAGDTVYLLSDVLLPQDVDVDNPPNKRERQTTATYSLQNNQQIAPHSYTSFTSWYPDDIHIDAHNRIWIANPGSESHGVFILQNVTSVYIQNLNIEHCANPGDVYASGILCLGSQNIQITYCHIYDTWGPSIKLYGCSNVVIDHNELETPEQVEGLDGKSVDGGLPIGYSCINVVVSYNTMHDVRPTDGANFVTVYAGSSNIQILGNKIYDVHGEQFGIYVISGHDVDIFANEVYTCWRGICVSNENTPEGTTVDRVNVYNNVCHDNAAGIVICPSGAGDRPINDVRIINNTVAYNYILTNGLKTGGAGIEILTRKSTGVVVRNNLVCYNGVDYPLTAPPCDCILPCVFGIQINNGVACATIDHNLLSGYLYKYQPTIPADDASFPVSEDPRFCARSTNNYHVASGSPALGKGVADPLVVNDFDGNPRDPDHDGKVTIGAFEPASTCTAEPLGSTILTSPVYDITVPQPKGPDNNPFPGTYNIRIGNSNPVIVVPANAGNVVLHKQPRCYTGTVAIEATGYYADPQQVTNLPGNTTLTQVTLGSPIYGTIASSTIWSGTIVLEGDVKVNSGVTLTIEAGTVIKVAPTDRANIAPGNVGLVDLIVEGTLKLKGTSSSSSVTFRSLGSGGPCSWGGIIVTGTMVGTQNNIPPKYVTLQDSRYGLTINTTTAWASGAIVNNSTFSNNLERDISIVNSPAATIATSTFDLGTGDGIQVLSSTGTITIRDNTFTGSSITQSAILVNDSGTAANSPTVYQNHINGDGQSTARTGNGLYCALGDPLIYNNDIRNWDNGIYITGGQPMVGQPKSGSTKRGNQISGCANGVNAVCATCSPSCFTTNVKYNIIANNRVGVIATAAVNLGQSVGFGTNHIYGNATCVWKQDNCALTVSAIGNYWDTSGTPCPEPTCKVPNTSAINTTQPQCGNFANSDGGCSFCVDPPANPPSMTVSLPRDPENVPERTALMGIHPNPFNPTTTVDFDLKEPAWTTISIYNVSGQLVRVESLATQPAGKHNWVWKGTDQRGNSVSSGVYFVVLRAGTITDRKKAVLLK